MKASSNILIAITGPTASGKTDLAIQIARHYGTEIISADSRQFYRETEIGTAKPSPQELSEIKHHFINNLSIFDQYTVGQYETEALAVLETLFKKNNIAVAVGGSGLFIKALSSGLDEMPEILPGIRETLNATWEQGEAAALVRELIEKDPEYARTADLSNPRRVIRALEVCRSTGLPFSAFRKASPQERNFKTINIGLFPPREALYARIDMRMDLMLAAGLEQEAHSLYPHRTLTALQTVGYSEFFDYFDGQYDLSECIRLLKRNSRRYAKRQITWFAKTPEIFKMETFGTNAFARAIASIEEQISGEKK